MQQADLTAQMVTLIDAGGSDNLVAAIILAVRTPIDPPAAVETGAATAPDSRDETHDSIDPTTGVLTADAVAKRAADKAADDVAYAELAVAAAEVADDEQKLADAKDRLSAAQARAAATQAAFDADAGGAMVAADPNDPAIQAPETVPASFGVVNKSTDVKKSAKDK